MRRRRYHGIVIGIYITSIIGMLGFLAVTTWAQGGSISVTDYGAIPNDGNDDAPAIQAALDAVALPGTVIIPAGTFDLGTSAGGVEYYPDGATPIESALIVRRDGVTLSGAGAGQTILKLMAGVKMRAISMTAKNIVLEKFTVDGNKAQRDGSVPWPNGDVVDGVVFGSQTAANLMVRFCEVRNTIEDGIGFWLSASPHVHDCHSHDLGTPQAGASGISISGATNAIVERNISERNTIGTWSAFGSSNVIIRQNTLRDNLQEGIIIGGFTVDTGFGTNTGYTIEDNVLERNGSLVFAALSIASASNGTIARNRVIDNYITGIQLSDQGTQPSNNWQILDNECSNTTSARLQDYGIIIPAKSQQIVLRSNTCKDNGTSIGNQIFIESGAGVNGDWQTVNTISFTPLVISTPTPSPSSGPSASPSATPTPTPTPSVTPTPTPTPSPTPIPGECINPSSVPTGFAVSCPIFGVQPPPAGSKTATVTITPIVNAVAFYAYTKAYISKLETESCPAGTTTAQGSAFWCQKAVQFPATAYLTGSTDYLKQNSGGTGTIDFIGFPASQRWVVLWDWNWNPSLTEPGATTPGCYMGPGGTGCFITDPATGAVVNAGGASWRVQLVNVL